MAAAAVLLSGCGAAGSGTGSGPSASPSTSAGSGFDVIVSEKDQTASLHVGQKLEVVLHAGNGMTNWTHPQSSDPTVLAPTVEPAATAVRGVTLAAFQAIAPGQAELTATAGPLCSPGQACPMYVVVYRLTVTVGI